MVSGTYLVDFHPLAFALIDLTVYHSGYLGQRHLKEEVTAIFLDSHSFLYKGNVMLFLHRREDMERFSALAEEGGFPALTVSGWEGQQAAQGKRNYTKIGRASCRERV